MKRQGTVCPQKQFAPKKQFAKVKIFFDDNLWLYIIYIKGKYSIEACHYILLGNLAVK
jgi:hypothetical protein